MAINFPNSPIVGQTYTYNEKTWQWSGSYWGVFSAQTGYVQGAINVGGGEEVFSGKSGNDLYFRTLTGGTNTTISTIGDLIKVDVTIPPDTNTFVTGFTYNDANTFTIGQNDGSNFSATINTMTGLTINGGIETTTLTGVSAYFSSDINVRGEVNYAKNATDPLVDIGEMAAYLHPMGRTQGGNISKTYPFGTGTSGRTITISDTVGFTMLSVSPTTHAITELNITGGDYVIAANSDLYVYYDRYGVFQTSAVLPSNRTNIILGRVITDSDSILYIENSRLNAHHMSNYQDTMFREAIGAVVSSGGFITENTSNPLQLDITNCTYFYSTSELELAATTGITFDRYYRDVAEPFFYMRLTASTPSVIDGLYDTGLNSLTGVTDGYYKKDLLMGIETIDGDNLYLLIYADSIHTNQTDAELSPLPPPPSFAVNTFIRLASIVSTTSGGTTTISSILDERPRIGFATSAVSQLNINDHSQLNNLGADDHLQYLRTDGGRVMTGPLDLGVNDIENVDNLTVINNTTLSGLTTVYGDTPTSPAIQPGVNNTYSLGAPSFRWNEIYTTNLDATNNVTVDNNLVVSGDTTLSDLSIYQGTVSGTQPKEIVNVEYLTAYTQSTDTFVTGGTYNATGATITLTRNDGGTISITGVTDYYLESVVFNSGNNNMTFTLNDGTPIVTNLDYLAENYYVTGGTFNNNTDTITLYRNDGGSIDITGITDTYITGFTYNNANQLTITDNYGGSISTTIDVVTGLTVNGEVNTDSIQFDTTFTATTAEGKLWWSQSHDTLHVGMGSGVTQEVGLDQYYHVGNPSGATINKGYAVFASGTDAVNERINVSPMIANGTVPSKYFIGVSTSNISSGQTGFVNSFGLIEDINASGSLYGESWSNGDILYVSPTISGGLTNVEPTSPNLKIETAFVLNNSATNGVIFIRPNISRNLGELNNVSADSPNNGDLLVYNSSNTLWESSKTLNGDYNITGTTSASTFNITSTPNTNTTDDDVLVRNSVTGEIENRNINSLIHTNNIITVGLTGSSGVDFYTIHDAINSITGASETNTYTVDVAGGLYYTDPVTIPSWVSVKGQDSLSTIIEANDPSQTLFTMSDQCAIFDCQVQGVTGTGISAIVYSSSTTPQSAACCYVENVRFGTNYTHAKVVAYGGANIIMQCSNVKYGGYPFTIGFHATNSGSGVGRMQLRNVTSTNGGIAQTTPLTFAKADASNCGFIVNGCLLTKAAGAAAGTGFYLENGGFLRLTAVNFQRWDIGIDAPNIGAGPNINAIALNFENCNTDVNIAHPNAVGKIQGTDTFLKTKINIDAPLYEVNQDPRQLTVAKKGGDFSSVKSAVDYLAASGNTSESNRFIISVGPGVFTEDEIDLTSTPYVSIVGSNIQTTQIVPSTSTQHIIKIGQNNEISFLSLSGAGTNYAAVYAYDIGDFGQLHKISIYDCDTGVWVESVTQDTKMYGEYVDMNGEFTYGTKAVGNNGYLALANMENYYLFPLSTGSTIGNYVTGSGATINVTSSTLEGFGSSGSTAFLSQDGGFFNVSSTDATNWDYGLRILNVGDPSQFEFNGVTFADNTLDISVEQASARGTFQGVSNHEKITTISENVYWSFLDATDGELDITRKASVTFTDGSHTDFTTLIFEGGTMGLIDGGVLSGTTGTIVNVGSGYGYLEKSDNSGIIRRYDWVDDTLTLPTDSDSYIYYNDNGILSYGGTRPDSKFNIVLGRVVTDSSNVLFIDSSPLNAEHTSNRFASLFREALGPIYALGSIVTEGTTPFTLDVTEGEYYFSTNEYLPMGGTGVTFTQYYRNGTGSTWVTSATTLVNNTQYDNNGTLTGLTSGYYTKHSLYVVGEGINEQYMLVLGQNEYSTLVQAEDALLPTPPSYFIDSVAQVASIYIKEGTSGFTQIEDIRPRVGFRAGGVNASSVHGNLLGLTADDHPQYLLADGARSMSGNLDVGGNNITNVNLVDGVDVTAHAARHQFGGADAVGSTTPSANAIPFADVGGTLDSWISSAKLGSLGLTQMSVAPAPTPIAIGINDPWITKAIPLTGVTYNTPSKTLKLQSNDGSTLNVTGWEDFYVTGGTFDGNKILLQRQDASFTITGFTDYYVTGGTLVGSTLTLNRQDSSFNITGFTDYYVTGGTYAANTLTLTRNDGNDVVVTGFTSGGVTSVTAGTGLSGDTTTGDITLINTAPDQTVTIVGGTDIGITGTYPNFTVSYTGSSSGGLSTKAGSVAGSSFAGNPKTFTVTFSTSFADANYSISLSSEINRNFTYESKTSSGFVINSNANASFTEDVDWICVKHGEV